MEAICNYDIESVKQCLVDGANPNYREFEDKDEPSGIIQPTTPLRMVMFRISDSFLEDIDLMQFAEIAQLLLASGADPKPALEIAQARYGEYIPGLTPVGFWKVYRIVAEAR